MRHWLAGVLAKEQPALFRALPDSYKVGAPLPPQPLSRPKKIRKKHLPMDFLGAPASHRPIGNREPEPAGETPALP
jgi:hypothetical protein